MKLIDLDYYKDTDRKIYAHPYCDILYDGTIEDGIEFVDEDYNVLGYTNEHSIAEFEDENGGYNIDELVSLFDLI